MLVWILTALADITPDPGNGGMWVNLLNVEWWQALGLGAIVLAGSFVPWVTALSAGRLLFRADLERQLAERDKAHAAAMAEKDRNHNALLEERAKAYALTQQALATEQDRNERLTDALGESTEALRVMNHALIEFNEVAKKATE